MSADRAMEGSLAGQLLIAMPGMEDPRFERSVIYMCAHSSRGAMGIVINKPLSQLSFDEILVQLEIGRGAQTPPMPIHFGGPVETARGFVLHSLDYQLPDSTLKVTPTMGLTATIDVLKAIAGGHGPDQAILALGYSGWSPGQLEGEIRANGWLNCPADAEIVFNAHCDNKWQRAMAKIGIDLSMLSTTTGRA